MNNNKDNVINKSVINWYPGHMAKTKREIAEKINLIDIVFEVIDARIPYSSKNKDIDNMIKNKPKILIMTKFDLCDQIKTNKWQIYYENKGYIVVTMNLLSNPNMNIIFQKITPIMKEINDKRQTKGLKPRRARVLVLGVPNVGKSTLINRLVGKKAVEVGNKPGITKNLTWIRINDKLELLDTPGILWPKLDNDIIAHNLASMTAIKEEILNFEGIATYIVKKMLNEYERNFLDRYDIKESKDLINIFEQIGKKIGAIQNGKIDYNKVYIRIIKDLQNGYLGKVTFDDINI